MPRINWQDLARATEDDSPSPAVEIHASPSKAVGDENSSDSSDPDKSKKEGALRGWRRSERVRIEMPVEVCVCSDDDQEPVFSRGKTINVSAHGALLDISTPVDIGQTLRVVNVRTKREIQCHVLRFVKRYPKGGGHVGVEFAGVSRHFWAIPSPPADWDPDWTPTAQPERPIPQVPPSAPSPVGTARPSPDDLPRTEKLRREPLQAPAIVRELQVRPRVPKGLTVALLASAVLLMAWMALRSLNAGDSTGANGQPAGVAPEDARRIPRIEHTHLATVEDFDPDGVSWLRGSGQQVSGKIPGFYSGSKKSNAYILVGEANERRVVVLAGGQLQYNAEYPRIAIAGCVPMELVRKIKWADPSVPESDGDGLLLVRAADAPASGVVLFLRSSQVVSASPVDYRDVPFGQGCQP